mmetsp:Transcript_29372/g.68196  ORF Transcript_29372/g.68196 Transcript_29372/m.68196 type:complete len:238 (+) Transcript_29372:585-1298(+)
MDVSAAPPPALARAVNHSTTSKAPFSVATCTAVEPSWLVSVIISIPRSGPASATCSKAATSSSSHAVHSICLTAWSSPSAIALSRFAVIFVAASAKPLAAFSAAPLFADFESVFCGAGVASGSSSVGSVGCASSPPPSPLPSSAPAPVPVPAPALSPLQTSASNSSTSAVLALVLASSCALSSFSIDSAASEAHVSHTRSTLSLTPAMSWTILISMVPCEHSSHTLAPQARQWWRRG